MLSFFLHTLGPPLPKGLYWHSMLEIQGDVFVFGGEVFDGWKRDLIYQLSCSSGICSWSKLNQELLVRGLFVAIPVPDYLCT